MYTYFEISIIERLVKITVTNVPDHFSKACLLLLVALEIPPG